MLHYKCTCVFERNGMLRENQLGTRSMINAITDEFWSMVESSINDQALLFKSEYMYCITCVEPLSAF